jgi:hypothetical protein
MALAFFDRSDLYASTNLTSYATATSFTPAALSLMICMLFASSTDTSEAQPTGVSGNGVTYAQHATTFFVSGVCSGSVWAGIAGGSPSAGVVTASGWGTARTGIGMAVFEITGADVSGTGLNAIQTVNKGGPATATSGTVTMTGPVSAGNLCCGMFDHTAAEVVAAGAGNTLGSTASYTLPNRGGGSVFNTGSTYANIIASWTTSAAWRAFGLEIKAAVAATAARPRSPIIVPTVAVVGGYQIGRTF